ncbi:MAG: hypothetical protein ACYC7E_03570 [Armatimonadota bacterium]
MTPTSIACGYREGIPTAIGEVTSTLATLNRPDGTLHPAGLLPSAIWDFG